MRKRTKFKLCFGLIISFLLILSVTILITTAKANIRDVVFEEVYYNDSYSIGDTITIKKIKAYDEDEELEVYALVQNGMEVVKNYTFQSGDGTYFVGKEGEFSIIYVTFDTYGYRHTKSFSFIVGATDRFDVSFQSEYSFGQFITTDIVAYIGGNKVSSTVNVFDPNGNNEILGYYAEPYATY